MKMVDPCEICGDVGFAKRIRICNECKASEHGYCRKSYGETGPDVWLCEKCELGVTSSPKWRKYTKTRKTKFLNPEDVIMLASGSKKFASSSRRVLNPSKPSINLTSRTMKPKPPTLINFPNMGGNSDFRRLKSSSPASVRGNISFANHQEALSSKDLKGKNAVQAPRKDPKSGKDIQSHSRTDKMVNKEAPCSQQPLGDCPPVMSSRNNIACSGASADIDQRKSGAENVELVNVLPEEKKVQGPAYSSSWMGNFRVPGTGTLQDLNVAIQAHTPDKVLWKVLEFSKKLPQVLSFELVPRPEVWTGIFQDYCPGMDDIGLYLFSGSSKRSENYVRLLKFMETSDLVLYTCVNGVELLVFPSKCLSTDSQKWGGEHFLWGLFRRVKNQKAEEKTQDNMETNMIGGIEVGIPEIPIPREPTLRIPRVPIPSLSNPISRNFTFLAQPLPSVPIVQSPLVSQNFNFPAQPPVLPGVRKQEAKDIPPAFEESLGSERENL